MLAFHRESFAAFAFAAFSLDLGVLEFGDHPEVVARTVDTECDHMAILTSRMMPHVLENRALRVGMMKKAMRIPVIATAKTE